MTTNCLYKLTVKAKDRDSTLAPLTFYINDADILFEVKRRIHKDRPDLQFNSEIVTGHTDADYVMVGVQIWLPLTEETAA